MVSLTYYYIRLLSVLIFCLCNFVTFVYGQTCSFIQPPPYGYLLRPCATNVGATCYIGCPDQFEILGSCFRRCVQISSATSLLQPTNFGKQRTQRPPRKSIDQENLDEIEFEQGFQTASNQHRINSNGNGNGGKHLTNKDDELIEMIGSCSACHGMRSALVEQLERLIQKDVQRIAETHVRQVNNGGAAWTGSSTFCVNTEVSCPQPLPPTNGYIFNSCPNFAGLECQFACSPGFR